MRHVVEVTYEGYDRDVDDTIRKAAKRWDDGSGASFLRGKTVRDLTFSFYTGPAARRACARIRRIRGVRVQVLS